MNEAGKLFPGLRKAEAQNSVWSRHYEEISSQEEETSKTGENILWLWSPRLGEGPSLCHHQRDLLSLRVCWGGHDLRDERGELWSEYLVHLLLPLRSYMLLYPW